jgi:hypothetical protein
MKAGRVEALRALELGSTVIAPQPVLKSILFSMHNWEKVSNGQHRLHTPRAGSLKANNTLLTIAFNEKMYKISWYQLLMGCISHKWEQAIASYTTNTDVIKNLWSSLFIAHFWVYIRTVWNTRNNILHGATAAKMANQIILHMREQVQDLYAAFDSTPSMILPQHH